MVTLCAYEYEAKGPSSSPAGAITIHPTRCKIGTRACSWELKSMDSSNTNDWSPRYMLAITCCLCYTIACNIYYGWTRCLSARIGYSTCSF